MICRIERLGPYSLTAWVAIALVHTAAGWGWFCQRQTVCLYCV